MGTAPCRADAFDRDAFERANAGLMSLKARLPSDAVTSVAREVVARLARRIAAPAPLRRLPTEADLDALCDALLSDDVDAGPRLIMALRDKGETIESIYLAHLASVARRLGVMWDEDRISFMQATVAASRIYAIIRAMRATLASPRAIDPRHMAFASVPGETHTIGVTMAADLFRRDGWDVELLVGLDHDSLVAAIEARPCALIGLSASGATGLARAARLVVALRIAAPQAYLMISGHVVEEDPDVIAHLGVDAVAVDAPGAIAQVKRLLGEAVRN